MKILKYALIVVGILVLVAGAGIAYIAATFDPNEYKPQLVKAVKEQTGRDLKLDGDIRLSFFPSIGARLGKASLSERGGGGQFVAFDDAKVVVKLMPLLSREVVVDAIEIKGLRANLTRNKDGSTNFEDLGGAGAGAGTGPGGKSGPKRDGPRIDIDHVLIEDSAVTYTDKAAGTRYAVSKLNLSTGRIGGGAPTRIELSAALQSDEPKLDVETALKTRASIDTAKQRYALDDLDLSVKGSAAGLSNLLLNAKGALAVRPAAQELTASKLSVTLSGKPAAGELDVKLEAPRLDVSKERVSGERVRVEARLTGKDRKLAAQAELAALSGSGNAFKADALKAEIDLQQDGTAVKASLSSPVSGSLEKKRVELPKLDATMTATGPQLPRSPMKASLRGDVDVDWGRERAGAVFSAKLDESNIKGKAGVAGFGKPAYTFDLDIDQIDADRYLPKTQAKGEPGAAPKAGAKDEQPLDLSALKTLNANGSLRIGSLKLANVKASNVRLDVKAANGKVDVSPIAASLYQGSLAGALAVDAQAVPALSVRQKLSGVHVGPLLKDLTGKPSLEGRGTVALDVTGRGATTARIKKTLDGSAAVNLVDGAVKGINVAQSIRSAKARLGTLRGEEVQQSDEAQKTDFSELTATFKIRDGVARNDDLDMKSPLLRVGGAGAIDIGEDKLDYTVKATIVGTTKGQGGREADQLAGLTVPVRVSGPLAAPAYRLDFSSAVADTVKQKIGDRLRDKIQERLGAPAPDKSGEKEAPAASSPADVLKGLFGR